MFNRLEFSGLLSFGPEGIDLPMESLNVLIGPNGSGKSNLLEAISLLQAAPVALADPISRMGGVREWLWKGPEASRRIVMNVAVDFPPGGILRHSLTLTDLNGRPVVLDEKVEPARARSGGREERSYYQPRRLFEGFLVAADEGESGLKSAGENSRSSPDFEGLTVHEAPSVVEFQSDYRQSEESMLYHAGNPVYPALWHLRERYKRIRLYRNWSFGPNAVLRQPCNAHARSDFLDEGAENLALVLSHLHGTRRKTFLAALGKLFNGIVDVQCPVTGGTVSLFLEETGDRAIPASRLSDGTLRYLSLLAVLLHPEPPPLICIEEPELGLHPDLLPTLADLMIEASGRSQLVVTTHSDVLVDALTDLPESVVVCEKHAGQTRMRRLQKTDLAKWLKDYRLGDLWTSGELGGNRW